jgi:hypothetical protein
LIADVEGERGGFSEAGEARWRCDHTSTGGLAVAVVLFMMVFDSGTEGVLEGLSQVVLHLDWNIAVF